ncbi:hypothetical protein PR002_g3346 [Phytophthora rubi]|uniref:Uncharacterized protein n=1 Tax=Phytophthora rubi TaxID=129364 RepID=A0A6A3NQP5_9STRA|nr:hypothetical protein PR002_g3346 [Phytophthora rubi]
MQVGIFEMHVKIHTQVRWHLVGAEIHEGVLLTRFMKALDDGPNSLSFCIPQPIQDRPWAPRRHAACSLYTRPTSSLRLSSTTLCSAAKCYQNWRPIAHTVPLSVVLKRFHLGYSL